MNALAGQALSGQAGQKYLVYVQDSADLACFTDAATLPVDDHGFVADLTDSKAAALKADNRIRSVEPYTGETRQKYVVQTYSAEDVQRLAKPLQAPSMVEVSKNTYVAYLTESEAAQIRKDKGVRNLDGNTPWRPLGLQMHSAWTGDRYPYPTKATRIDQVHAEGYWGDGVEVALVDTGIDLTQFELGSHVLSVWDYLNNSATQSGQDNGHGTSMAGNICASDNNSGIMGAAPHAKLRVYRVINGFGHGGTAEVLQALNDIAKVPTVKVVNISLSGDRTDAIAQALATLRAQGKVVLAGAGNDNTAGVCAHGLSYPAADPNVVAVGAAYLDKSRVDISNCGPFFSAFSEGSVQTFPTLRTGMVDMVLQDGTEIWGNGGAPSDTSALGVLRDVKYGEAADFANCGSGCVGLVHGLSPTDQRYATINPIANAKAAGATGIVNLSYSLAPYPYNPSDLSLWLYWQVGVSNENASLLASQIGHNVVIRSFATDFAFLGSSTSDATSRAAGVAALAFSAKPDATRDQVVTAMQMSAIANQPSGYNPNTGHGVIDAKATVDWLKAPHCVGKCRAARH